LEPFAGFTRVISIVLLVKMAAPGAPIVKYAQRTDSIYVTIECADVKDEKIELTEDSLSFKGNSSGRDYVMDVKLFKKINVEESITKVLPRSIQIFMKKAEAEDEYWPRMLEDKGFEKKHFKIDWDKWKDEDEGGDEDFDKSQLAGGDQGGGMGGMGGGGMPGMPGMGGGGGGAGGMDMAALQQMMAGMGGGAGGGAGGMGGMDMASMMAGMGGGAGGGGDGGDGGADDDDDDDDDDIPGLEGDE
jgi:hypothetical protein